MRAKRVSADELLERVPARLRPRPASEPAAAERRRHGRLMEWLRAEGLAELEAIEVSLELKRRAAQR